MVVKKNTVNETKTAPCECAADISSLKEKVNVLYSVMAELISLTGTGNRLLGKHNIKPYVLTEDDLNIGKWKAK